jgi:hypothetical protein
MILEISNSKTPFPFVFSLHQDNHQYYLFRLKTPIEGKNEFLPKKPASLVRM